MEYDDLGRVLKVKKTVNSIVNGATVNKPEHLVVQNEYDNLGQLKTKKLGNKVSVDEPVETLVYDYNIRGWLLGMNRDYLAATGQGGGSLFGFELGYDKLANNSGRNFTAGQYNGNITGMTWKSDGDDVRRKYDFTYDGANRIMKGVFEQDDATAAWNNTTMNYTLQMGNGTDPWNAYDANGNIKGMKQYGWKLGTPASLIDDLSYTYFTGTNKLQTVTDAVAADNKLGDFTDKNTAGNDYGYDKNGNLVTDLNKRINGTTGTDLTSGGAITYNHLNLPAQIAVKNDNGTDKGTITYTYDAAGNKLQKTVSEIGQPAKTTLYLAGGVYENDVLQFLGQEEGRIRFKPGVSLTPASFEYDYFVKDHLGSVRMVLTEEQKIDQYPAATMETAPAATEETFYTNLPQTRIGKPTGYPADNTTNPNDYVARVSGGANASDKKIGPAITLKVMAGDKFNIRASSWYKTNGSSPNTPANPLPDLLTALINGVSSAAGGVHGITPTVLQNSGVLTPGATGFLNNQSANSNSSKPQAFLNWILFDEQFKMVSSGSGFEQVGDNEEFKLHVKDNLPVDRNGYLYIYIGNNTPNIDVFFDNLQVTHIRGPLLEETHYYPFGLTMAGISSRAAGDMCNKEKTFQGQRFDDEFDLDWVQFKWRNHDPQIGRFIEIDPLAEKYNYNSPYAFSENKVTTHVELEGLEAQWFGFKLIEWAGNLYGGKKDLLEGAATSVKSDAGDYKEQGVISEKMHALKGPLQQTSGLLEMNKPAAELYLAAATMLIGVEIPAEAALVTGVPKAAAAKVGFNASAFADEIVAINKTTEGGGKLLSTTPSSVINSAMYYETAAEQGSSIFRSIIANHMFHDGNKRTAVLAFQSFAKQNGLKTVSQQEMMNVATKIATGKISEVSEIVKLLIR